MKAWAICVGILAFFVVGVSSAADMRYAGYSFCPNKLRTKGQDLIGSKSCWSKVSSANLKTDDPKTNADFVELSKMTLTGLIGLLAKDIEQRTNELNFPGIPKERLVPVKSALESALMKGDSKFGAAYFFDVFSLNDKQTDCNFYIRRGPKLADLKKPVSRFHDGIEDCTAASNDLADIIGRASDLAAIRVVDPLDIFIFARFPNGKFSKQLASASSSLSLFLKTRLQLYGEETKGLPFEFMRVAVPGFKHKTEVTEDLVRIAEKFLGNGNYWPALWTINAARVSDPHKIPSGVEIIIPATPNPAREYWEEIKAADSFAIGIAKNVYGDPAYADFVDILRDKQFELAGKKGDTFLIPKFGEMGKFKPIKIDIIRRTAK